MSLRELARRAGCSASLLSQVERGQTVPSAGIVYSLANELKISLDSLFSITAPAEEDSVKGGGVPMRTPETRDQAGTHDSTLLRFPNLPLSGERVATRPRDSIVQRAGSRRRIELMTGVTWERLTPHPDAGVDFLEVHYAPRAHSTESDYMIRHEGTEYLVVLEGEIHADVGFETYRLEVGDSVAFESSTPHQYRNVADAPARAISIVVHNLDPA